MQRKLSIVGYDFIELKVKLDVQREYVHQASLIFWNMKEPQADKTRNLEIDQSF